jgi:hypothetical protein
MLIDNGLRGEKKATKKYTFSSNYIYYFIVLQFNTLP